MKLQDVEQKVAPTETVVSGSSNNPMKILLFYRGLNARAFWQRLVEAQLKRLQHLAAIASVRVTLERQREIKPPFKVKAWLEVPGPDYHAEATDHTLPAALHKVIRNLERQIQTRRNRLARKRRHRTEQGLLPRLPSLALGGHQA